MEFKVKRDFLPIFLVNVLLAAIICVAIPFFYNVAVGVIVVTLAVAVAVFYDTAVIFASCSLTDETLTFRTGVFKYVINLKDIVKVDAAKNVHSSLALSYDRIRILTNKDGKQKVYYIAVDDNEKLISLLAPKTTVEKEKEEVKPVEEKKEKTATVKKATTAKKTTTKSAASKSTTKKTTATKKTK